ncbi:hypothetical protein D3C79_921630 [compost metagenome]
MLVHHGVGQAHGGAHVSLGHARWQDDQIAGFGQVDGHGGRQRTAVEDGQVVLFRSLERADSGAEGLDINRGQLVILQAIKHPLVTAGLVNVHVSQQNIPAAKGVGHANGFADGGFTYAAFLREHADSFTHYRLHVR